MAITAAQLNIKFTTDGVAKTRGDIQSVGSSVDSANRKSRGFLTTLAGTAGGFLTAGFLQQAAGGVLNLGQSFIMANANAEAYRNQLNVATGDTEKAGKLFDWLKGMAASTPFEFPELLQGAANLEALGMSSQKWMPIIGDTAAGTNKSINQTVQAVLDASSGEFERLKEFGIRTKVEGDKVKFSFMQNGKEMVVEAENTQTGIQNALMGIWDQKYDGAMKTMSNTFLGRLSTLKDNIGLLMQDASKPLFNVAKAGLGFANSWFSAFDRFRKQGLSPVSAGFAALRTVINDTFGPVQGAKINGYIDSFRSGLETIWSVGGRVAGVIGGVLGAAFGFLAGHMNIVMPILKAIGTVLLGALAWGALTGVLTAIGAAFAFLLSPIGLLIAAIALLYIAWDRNLGDIQGKTAALVDFLQGSVWPVIKAGIDGVIAAWNTLKAAWDVGGLSGVGSALVGIFGNIAARVSAAIGDGLQWLSDKAAAALQGMADGLAFGIQLAWDAITNLTWSDFIDFLNWFDWIPGFDWLKVVAPFYWDMFVDALDWNIFATLLDWALFISSLDWWDAITNLTWSDFIDFLNWFDWIPGFDWLKVVAPFYWDMFIDTLDWGAFVESLDLGSKVNQLVWSLFVTALDLESKVNELIWSLFVTAISLDSKVNELIWSLFVTAVSLAGFVKPLAWSLFITAIELSFFVKPLAWSLFVIGVDLAGFVGRLAWSLFVTSVKLEWFVTELIWDHFITNVDLHKKVGQLAWSLFVTSVKLELFVGRLAWSLFVTSVKLEAYVAKLVWTHFITNVDLWKKVGQLTWSLFVTSVKLELFVGKLAWSLFVKSVKLELFVAKLAWSLFVKGVDLAKFVVALSWDLFVTGVNLAGLVPDFPGWPSKSEILSALTLGVLGGEGSKSTPDPPSGGEGTVPPGQETRPYDVPQKERPDGPRPEFGAWGNVDFGGITAKLNEVKAAALGVRTEFDGLKLSTDNVSLSFIPASTGVATLAASFLTSGLSMVGSLSQLKTSSVDTFGSLSPLAAAAALGVATPLLGLVTSSFPAYTGGLAAMKASTTINFAAMKADVAGQTEGIKASIVNRATEAKDVMLDRLSTMRASAVSRWSEIASSTSGRFAEIAGSIRSRMSEADASTRDRLASMAGSTRAYTGEMVSAASSNGARMSSSLTNAAGTALSGVQSKMSQIPGAVSSASGAAGAAAAGLGNNIGNSLVNALQAQIARVRAVASQLANAAADALRAALAIGSPSKVMIEIANQAVEGLLIPLRGRVGEMVTAARGMAKAITPELKGVAGTLANTIGDALRPVTSGPRAGNGITTTRMDLPVASGVTYGPTAAPRPTTQQITYAPVIHQQPGENSEALAQRVFKLLIQGGNLAEGGAF